MYPRCPIIMWKKIAFGETTYVLSNLIIRSQQVATSGSRSSTKRRKPCNLKEEEYEIFATQWNQFFWRLTNKLARQEGEFLVRVKSKERRSSAKTTLLRKFTTFNILSKSDHSVKKWGLVATQVPRRNPAGLDVDEVADMNTSATDLDDNLVGNTNWRQWWCRFWYWRTIMRR